MTSVFLISLVSSYARPKAIGTTFSFTGIAISYEHQLEGYDAFVETSLKAEMSEVFVYRTENPGISASVTLNFPFAGWTSPEGNRLSLYAGPGMIAGYVKDFRQQHGYAIGLMGRFGIECKYLRKISISAFISPTLGAHIEQGNDFLKMKYFKNGIILGLVPEIGLKYSF